MKFVTLFSIMVLCLMMSSKAYATGSPSSTIKGIHVTVHSYNYEPKPNTYITLISYSPTGGSTIQINKQDSTNTMGTVDFFLSESSDNGGTARFQIENEDIVAKIPGGSGAIRVTIRIPYKKD